MSEGRAGAGAGHTPAARARLPRRSAPRLPLEVLGGSASVRTKEMPRGPPSRRIWDPAPLTFRTAPLPHFSNFPDRLEFAFSGILKIGVWPTSCPGKYGASTRCRFSSSLGVSCLRLISSPRLEPLLSPPGFSEFCPLPISSLFPLLSHP